MSFSCGCLKPKTDLRDYKIVSSKIMESLPSTYALDYPRTKYQGVVSSCVAFSMSSALEYHSNGQKLSTDFIYGMQYSECGRNSKGMYLSDACKIVQKYGDMLEEDCPTNTEMPAAASKAEAALNDKEKAKRAEAYKIKTYYKCENEKSIKYAIKHYGPVVLCTEWPKKFSINRSTGYLTPRGEEFSYHAVLAYGWTPDGWCVLNSWGNSFGKEGKCILPYSVNIRDARVVVDDETIGEGNEALKKTSIKKNSFQETLVKGINNIINFFKGCK